MDKKKKDLIFNISVFIIFIGLVYFLLIPNGSSQTSEEVAKCIGENSIVYVRVGCSHCVDQEEMFGNNSALLNKIDCFYELDRCQDIDGTPTWKIKGKLYVGVQSIKKLQELTGC